MLNDSSFSDEELGLLNPAYVGFLLYSSLLEFEAFKKEGMNCALPFIAMPMAMNKQISTCLPTTVKTTIGAWVASNEGALASLHSQAESYNNVVKSSISFLLDRNVISICKNGNLRLENKSLVNNPVLFTKSADMKEALKASRMIGRWFSHAPSVETIFAQLGVRP
ncbi:MAG: three component ABC system middle component [Glaciecola sp.]|jgi:hypothetical protein